MSGDHRDLHVLTDSFPTRRSSDLSVNGVTPKQYATAQRSDRVRKELERGSAVTTAIFDAGYNASSRFYETANQVLGMTPSSYRAGGADSEIRLDRKSTRLNSSH